MGDPSNSRLAKRQRTGANARQLQAPQPSGSGAESVFEPGPTAAREDDILYFYEIITWPPSLDFRQIRQPAPLPSPLSPFLLPWLNNTTGDLLGSMRGLYNLIYKNAEQLQNEFNSKYPYFGSDSKLSGFFCWAEYTFPSGGLVTEETLREKSLNGFWVAKLGLNSLKL